MKWVAIAMGAIAVALAATIFGTMPQVEAPAIQAALLRVDVVPSTPAAPAGISVVVEPAAPPPNARKKAPSASTEEEWSISDPPAVAARRMREAKDKRAFFDKAIKMESAAYLRMAMDVRMQCFPVAQSGAIAVEQRFAAHLPPDDPHYQRRLAGWKSIYAGCEGFEGRPMPTAEIGATYAQMAKQSDPLGIAFAATKGGWNADTHAEIAAKFRRLIEMDDPYLTETILTRILSHEYGMDDRSKFTSEGNKRFNYDQVALWWAMCDLGKDCGPDSFYGRSLCATRNLCDWQHIDEIGPKAFNTWDKDHPTSKARRDEFVSAVRNRDWEKLGIAPPQ